LVEDASLKKVDCTLRRVGLRSPLASLSPTPHRSPQAEMLLRQPLLACLLGSLAALSPALAAFGSSFLTHLAGQRTE
jgi:hypothetical protein